MSWTVGIAYDGALAGPGGVSREAAALVAGVKEGGGRVVVLTSRATWSVLPAALDDSPAFFRAGTVPPEVETAWQRYDEMREALRAAGVWGAVEIWTSPGTPIVDFLVAPQAGPVDFLALAAALGIRLPDGRGGPPEMARAPAAAD